MPWGVSSRGQAAPSFWEKQHGLHGQGQGPCKVHLPDYCAHRGVEGGPKHQSVSGFTSQLCLTQKTDCFLENGLVGTSVFPVDNFRSFAKLTTENATQSSFARHLPRPHRPLQNPGIYNLTFSFILRFLIFRSQISEHHIRVHCRSLKRGTYSCCWDARVYQHPLQRHCFGHTQNTIKLLMKSKNLQQVC